MFTIILLAVLPCALTGSTIETNKLFHNTIKRWNIEVAGSSDLSERFKRFVKAKDSVDRTTRGVTLESLNRFSVLNDAEYEVHVGPLERQLRSKRSLENLVGSEGESAKKLRKRSSTLAATFSYWEEDVGLKAPMDQLSCGSCWSFPETAAMEALYKEQTGEAVEFSQQYFVDCTFNGDGCGGGAVNDGYKLTMMRQFALTEAFWPYTAYYQTCQFDDDIVSFDNNALTKLWFTSSPGLSTTEAGMLAGLLLSPVAFGAYVSTDLLHYSGGPFSDTNCASDANAHSMLLVGYTETTLRVRNSYGDDWGEGGYINYVRGDVMLDACSFYVAAYAITVTYRREMEYEWCNSKKVGTRFECLDSCEAMNTASETGWTLAVIPTKYHNNLLTEMAEAEYPGVKGNDKFNYLWIGVTDMDKVGDYAWVDDFTPVNYYNTTEGDPAKYGMLNKNTGKWMFKNSLTYEARGLCSRPTTCWDIGTAVTNGAVTFDRTTLTEGTVARVECEEGFTLEWDETLEDPLTYCLLDSCWLTCAGGEWSSDLPTCS